MKKTSRSLALLLALVLFLGPVSSLAMDGKEVARNYSEEKQELVATNEITYSDVAENDFEFDSTKGRITRYKGSGASIVIPSRIDGVAVVHIGNYAFSNNEKLKNIKFSEGLKSIGDSAFFNCGNLVDVELPKSLELIGEGAFSSCEKLKNIKFYEGLKSIGDSAFSHCYNLVDVELPKSLELIGNYAFYSCDKLKKVKFSEGLKSIGDSAFSDCKSLNTVSIPGTVESIGGFAFGGCENLISIDIPKGVEKLGEYAFRNCKKLETVNIPSTLTSIGEYCFDSTPSLSKISVDNSNKDYLDRDGVLFSKSPLTLIKYPPAKSGNEYKIPENTKALEEDSLAGSNNLTRVEIPSGLRVIGARAFMECLNLSSVDFSNGLEKIGYNAFGGCKNLEKMTLPNGLIELGDLALYNCENLKEIEIPSSVEKIGSSCFFLNPSLSKISVDKGNSHFSDLDGVLFNKKKTLLIKYPEAKKDKEYAIPQGVLTLKSQSIHMCNNLTNITIPDSVRKIDAYAIEANKNLKNITIPSSVTEVGNGAFSDSNGLEWAKFEGNEPKTFGEDVFLRPGKNFVVYYYKGAKGFTNPWNGYPTEEKDKASSPVTRISGKNRYSTALEVSRESYKTSEKVVLASGQEFPDAMVGNVLASSLKAPLLLTKANSLDTEILEEILGLGASEVVVLGGQLAVSSQVMDSLEAKGLKVTRLAGKDRFSTAAELAQKIQEDKTGHAFIVSGEKYPDALSIGPVAAMEGSPILLARKDRLTRATVETLRELKIESVTIIGGNAVVSKKVEKELDSMKIDHDRVSGGDRYKTSHAVAVKYFRDIDEAIVASGGDYPDALVGGYMAALRKAPVLLVKPDKVMDYTLDYLVDKEAEVRILGGNLAISSQLDKTIEDSLKR